MLYNQVLCVWGGEGVLAMVCADQNITMISLNYNIQFNSIHAFISDKSLYYTGYINYNHRLFIQHLLSALFTIKRALMRYEKYMKCIHKTF